jgi:hypothetical protein
MAGVIFFQKIIIFHAAYLSGLQGSGGYHLRISILPINGSRSSFFLLVQTAHAR